MKFVVFSTLSLLASAASAFHVVSPGSITSCGPLTVQYDTRSGQAPFSLSFHDSSADGPVLAAFTDISGTSYTWDTVTIPAGTNVVVLLGDSNGKASGTPVITVAQGSSDVCLNNPTSVPVIPTFTTTYSATSSFTGSLPSLSSSLPSSLSTTGSLPTGISSSLSSVLNSAGSVLSSSTTDALPPNATSGLGTNGGVANIAGFFTVGAISAVIGAFLA